jgi:hypothetical protein
MTKFHAEFNDHLSAYCIDKESENGVTVYRIEILLDSCPLSAYIVKNNKYVALKNFVYNHDVFFDRSIACRTLSGTCYKYDCVTNNSSLN